MLLYVACYVSQESISLSVRVQNAGHPAPQPVPHAVANVTFRNLLPTLPCKCTAPLLQLFTALGDHPVFFCLTSLCEFFCFTRQRSQTISSSQLGL